MELSRAKTNRVLPENALVIANTLFQQHKRRLHMDIREIRLIIFLAAKDGEALYNQQKQDQELADCGSDDECFIAKLRLK